VDFNEKPASIAIKKAIFINQQFGILDNEKNFDPVILIECRASLS
jgi:hypothetical protein